MEPSCNLYSTGDSNSCKLIDRGVTDEHQFTYDDNNTLQILGK